MKIYNSQTGAALISVIVTLPFLLLIAYSFTRLSVNDFNVARKDQFHTHSQITADAGLDLAIQQINQISGYTGTGGEITLDTVDNVKTTYEVTVGDLPNNYKLLTSVGRTYRPATSTTPATFVRIESTLRPVSSGEYSVVSGVGGLIMSNSSKILGGDVFINGKIQLSNTAQIGLSTNPVNLSVAHNSCPSPPTAAYPRLCNSGENGQPITLNNSAKIYGNVKANNQTNGTNMFSPGLTASSGVAAQALPAHDRAGQKAALATTITSGTASCSSGTKTIAANTKITGDWNISNSCQVTVNGNVWVTGKLIMSNSSQMIVSNSLGATRPVIMVDGDIVDLGNSSLLKSNSSSTGFMIINYKSDASCSPDCADVTGSDLFNSQDDERIKLSNSASGPNTIFYARWTKVTVSNSGQIGALVGQTVQINNSGSITFGSSTGTGSTYWVVDGYRRQFN